MRSIGLVLRGLCLRVSVLALAIVIHANANADTPVSADEQARCEALTETNFTKTMDAPTIVNEALVVANPASLIRGLSTPSAAAVDALTRDLREMQPYCRVRGYVSPQVGFELALPMQHWNGKFLHIGCGGWCGDASWYAAYCALARGYACIGTDMGHTGESGLWMRNNNLQGQSDFAYRATHVATLAGKAIVERYYGKDPQRSYFSGCSTGGYQAMMEAQAFPWDFDGIIAGAPDMDESDLSLRGIWLKQNFLDKANHPILNADEIQLLHRAVLERCDMDDGVKDGIISDPVHCKFDPAVLACKPGEHSGCLTSQQVQAVKNIYGVPVTSKGLQISTRGVFPGSELNWPEDLVATWGDTFFKNAGLLTPSGTEWKYSDFDFDRDYKRSGTGWLFADTNPDLRRFKAAGGKLLSYQGGNDTSEIPGAVVDYYETVERTMGGRAATQDFYRLFVIPGMNHCDGGDGAYAIDYLHYLEDWVEHGRAPDVMIGAHLQHPVADGKWGRLAKYPLDETSPATFYRPVYPYPLHAKYKGKGDPNKAESFGSTGP